MKKLFAVLIITAICYPNIVFAANKKQGSVFPRTNCKISLPDSGRNPSSKHERNKDKIYYIYSESKKDCAQTAKWYESMFKTVTGSNESANFEFYSN